MRLTAQSLPCYCRGNAAQSVLGSQRRLTKSGEIHPGGHDAESSSSVITAAPPKCCRNLFFNVKLSPEALPENEPVSFLPLHPAKKIHMKTASNDEFEISRDSGCVM